MGKDVYTEVIILRCMYIEMGTPSYYKRFT